VTDETAICWGGLPEGARARDLLERAARFSSGNGVMVQLFDADAIAGEAHLRSAAMHALRAFERRSMRSSSVGMEMMLYASGRRQIREALEMVGVQDTTRNIAAIVLGKGARRKCDALVDALGMKKLTEAKAAGGARAIERLKIPSKGVPKEKLRDLALEQVALLDIER
jgi:KEOPS complex subunit Cgi121